MSAPHLILVGGGHTHVHVLKSLAMRPQLGLRLTLVSPDSYATYSGMVPGVLAGRYEIREAQIDLRALAARARARFVADRAVRIDAVRRHVALETRPPLAYDLLSLDIGSRPAASDRVAGTARAVMVKPIEVAAGGVEAALDSPAPANGRKIVIVGAGAGGTEIAFALAARLRREGNGSITVCDAAPRPLAARGRGAARAVLRAFARHGIRFVGSAEVEAAGSEGVRLGDRRILPADLVVWATGAAGPPLFADSGLPVDERGFLRVGDDLRCVDHEEIFAAGDCATLRSYPDLPKAGVYAVRQGPVLDRNLRAAASGRRVRPQVFTPQRRFLSLLNTCDGRSILSYGPLALTSRWAWRLKDRIDRRFIEKYARPDLARAGEMGGEMVPCGGCAAKVGADVLARVLARLDVPRSEGLLVGIAPADDAAVFSHPAGMLALATADAFPPFDDDLYLVGRVAAVNAASDLYAMGGEGTAAVALVCLPHDDERETEAQLEHFLRGALQALAEEEIPLAGGHTIAGDQTVLGFSMHGCVDPQSVLRKGGARPGDRLVLTKALGTGVVLAAARAGFAAAEWVEAAHASMLRSNRNAARLLLRHDVRACTDVTGFGLGGHLNEMLRASGASARLHADALPFLPGARDLLAAGWRSSFHADVEKAQPHDDAARDGAAGALLFDPQTSGGLLAAVPPARLAELLDACREAGEEIHVIGEVVEGQGRWEMI